MMITIADIRKQKRWDKYNINKTWQQIDQMGVFYDGKIRLGPFEGINRAWQNEPCFIVGGSKALEGIDLKKLDGMHTIGINHVIEDYDGFEWFIFLDQRFLDRTTYDINKFKGKIFASNKTVFFGENIIRFRGKSQTEKVTTNIEDGLWNCSLTGLCAVNLAICAGANPIYLLGMDNKPEYNHENYHYKKDYTGEDKSEKRFKKYLGANGYHKEYEVIGRNRIFNVCPGGVMPFYKQIAFNDIDLSKIKKKAKKENKQIKISGVRKTATICHLISMNSMDEMGDISRQVYNLTDGKHIYSNINNKVHPKADIYLLECFINGAERYIHFQKPARSKVISIIHSSSGCLPAICSDRVINLTTAWQKVINKKGFKSDVIYAGIEIDKYNMKPDYSKKTFGRITRNSPGKVHPEWHSVVKNVLGEYDDAKCYMITDNPKATVYIDHERMKYITDVKINETERKVKELSRFSVFADAHNTFQETFSLGLLEAMASAQAIVMLKGQPAMEEVLGGAGIICDSIPEFEKTIIELLPDAERKAELGNRARKRAHFFTVKKMVDEYNKIFAEVMNG